MPGKVRLVMRPLIWAVHVWMGCRLSVHRTTLAAGSMLPITWRLMFGASCSDEAMKSVEFKMTAAKFVDGQ